MKTFPVLLLLAAALHAEEPAAAPAPAPAPAASAVLAAIAGGASSPSEPTARAEPAERAEPAAPGGDAIQHSAFSTQHSPLSATVSLSDGSILKGALRPRFLPAVSPSLGRVRIDLAKVERIDFIPTSGGNSAGLDRRDRLARLGSQAAQVQQVQSVQPVHDCRVSFTNGDTLTATLSPRHDRFVLDTLLGRVRLPLRAVSSISFNPSTPSTVSTSSTPSTLLYHCTFDSPSSISRPAAGPAGAFLGGVFVPGKKGRALLVKARTPAAEVPFPTGLMRPEGCIEFWAKIPGATKETRYPDGGNPMFFAMGVGKWVNTFVKYTANDGFGTGGLHADLPGSAYVSSLPSWSGSAAYPDFLGDPAAWHHYALVWSEDGLPAASEALGRRVVSALYVDGRLVNPAYGTNGPDRAKFLREFVVNPVVLGFPYPLDRKENNKNDVDYLIDEFKIWSAPKTDFAIPPAAAEPPRLLYHCTFDDAAAIERPAAGPSGTFLGGTFEEGKAGNALRVRKGLSSAIVRFEKGVLRPRGTIEFWAKIENDRETFGDGGDPRFFMMETAPGSETVFQLAANDGCGRGGLSIYHQGLSAASEDHCLGPARYDSVVPGATKGWHHYALVWDETGVPGPDGPVALAAFIDGRRIPLHGDTGLAKAPRMAARFLANPATLFLSLNPELDRGFNNKTDFLIDEFKIWSAPKTAFDIR